jgi:hypothetical protein
MNLYLIHRKLFRRIKDQVRAAYTMYEDKNPTARQNQQDQFYSVK